MLLTIDDLLQGDEVALVRALLSRAEWSSGALTAGTQAVTVKNNQQIAEDAPLLPELRRIVLAALNRSPLFFTAALPHRIVPPCFNRYADGADRYGAHIDNSMRALPDGNGYVRADVSATLFLSDPAEYDGGELVIEDTYGRHEVKLPAGSLVLYPSSSVHQVQPVTRGERIGCFMFIQSLVRDAEQRRLLFDLDMELLTLRQQLGETPSMVRLTGVYHNLLRRWGDT
ncbi:2OG-Fe(II) oxygenase superfamily protein [Methyloversatilis sp. RAC08]|uniref:Fe2+-dependent dioxygenase n=1 Tax=Methyloversatilis sp. RAC08 TaxID=1842540 RepID=UPI00083D48ED|nr:Fe2+-dependent dioxygenase [Methyloversatilis sp. RAC08]AOF80710.1 2OG-Fe(II) oxygenase superfamily protein [Methyloversatilis sp. RAC08]